MGFSMGFREPSSPHPSRAVATNPAQEVHGAWLRASFRHNGLEGPVRSEEQSLPPSHVTSHLTGETPPNQAVVTDSIALSEARPEATGLQSLGAPSFREVLARAAKAHYLRHRVPPEAERLLSMGEIFGHGGLGTPCRVSGGHLSNHPVSSE